MDPVTKDNIHFVSGERNHEGFFLTKCPHGEIYEYINGFGFRMVGSSVCRNCKYYADKNRNKIMQNDFTIKCGHEEGVSNFDKNASILKINF